MSAPEKERVAETVPRAVIFASYGWADAEEIARRISTSLKDANYDVWIDSEHLRPDETRFSVFLQNALENSRLVIALLSPHSVRLEGDVATAARMSVCHNELILAVQRDMPVVPVTVIECDPPLVINQYDPIVFTNWQYSPETYRAGIEEIRRWIEEGLVNRRRYRVHVDNLSRDRLNFPEERTAEASFVGRNWLMERLEAWFLSDRRCFLIEAEPGSGKTALVAELVRRNPADRILAYHFCSLKSPRTLRARVFVRSLAAMLCGTVPDYARWLRSDSKLIEALQSDDPGTMLWDGALNPLGKLEIQQTRCVIVDALDEAEDGSQMSIPRLLSQAHKDFPPWLKLVVTTRRNDEILRLFQSAERCYIGESVPGQREDLREHIDRRFADPKLGDTVGRDEATRRRAAAAIAERSGGNFQYATMVLDELSRGNLDMGKVDHLPSSLAELYDRLADLRFPKVPPDFDSARLLLSVLLAARRPVTRSQLALITGLDRNVELAPTLEKLSCFVTWDTGVGDERFYRPAHKSISDWLIAPPSGSDRFKVDLTRGRELILAHCRKWATHYDDYALTHLIEHLLESGFAAEALAAVRGGFFGKRQAYAASRQYDRRHDLDDARALTLALVADKDSAAILELAQTDNVWQRDGVAAALQSAPPAADDFVDGVVRTLLRVS
jgi:hypothetical protein